MVTQPTALRLLIEDLELNHEFCPKEVILQAGAELRRLHELNQELVKALKEANRCLAWHEEKHGVGMDRLAVEKARAAIAKATGENK